MRKRRERPAVQRPDLTIDLGAIPESNRDACARLLTCYAVEKALSELGLDNGPTTGDNGRNQHKEAPPVLEHRRGQGAR
jgi:hypothetical protein